MLTVFVVSDATGEIAERVTRSGLTQFGDAPVSIVRRGGIRTPEQGRDVVAEAAGRDCVIIHTMVSNELRKEMLEEIRAELAHAHSLCHDHGWRRIDVTGKSVEEVAREILVLGRYEAAPPEMVP